MKGKIKIRTRRAQSAVRRRKQLGFLALKGKIRWTGNLNAMRRSGFEKSFMARKSGEGPPQSKTLARIPAAGEWREAFWSAPVLWRFGRPGVRSDVNHLKSEIRAGNGRTGRSGCRH
jgi:hypothetical protein